MVITEKEVRRFSLILLFAGLGGLWLTFCWGKMSFGDGFFSKHIFSSYFILIYYIFNSSLLILLSYLFRTKNFSYYSTVSVVLLISVLGSLLIFGQNQYVQSYGFLNNLFINTVVMGMWMGFFFGGTFLVPFFLVSVFVAAERGIKFLQGKITYVDEEINAQITNAPTASTNQNKV